MCGMSVLVLDIQHLNLFATEHIHVTKIVFKVVFFPVYMCVCCVYVQHIQHPYRLSTDHVHVTKIELKGCFSFGMCV